MESRSSSTPAPDLPTVLRDEKVVETGPNKTATLESDTDTLDNPDDGAVKIPQRDTELYFVPIPKHLRHDPENPPHFGLSMNILFGIASTFLVANLYYCQPLLIQLSHTFNVTYDEVSRIPTLVQAGYATGLLLLTPLGDLVRRRPLILLLTLLSTGLTLGLPLTSSIAVFEALTFLVGAMSVVPQILMPFAADLAPPERRASALSIVLSGLLFGVLIARVLAGVIANFVTWRVVYWLAFGLQVAILLTLYWMLPDWPAKNEHLTYFKILYTMAKFTVPEPLLIQSVFVNMASMACFTNFWVTLTFLLGGPNYNYNTLDIGLFGLVGMVGVSMAPIVGRVVDGLVPWFATVIATFGSLIFYSIQLGGGGVNIAAVIIACFGIDVFRQTQQVSLTHAVFGLDASARSRLNAVLIISIFIGQIVGTSVGTSVFNSHGWRPAAALSVGWQGFCLIMLFLRGPHVTRYTWFGYSGGFEMRKRHLHLEVAASVPPLEKNASAAQEESGAGDEKLRPATPNEVKRRESGEKERLEEPVTEKEVRQEGKGGVEERERTSLDVKDIV